MATRTARSLTRNSQKDGSNAAKILLSWVNLEFFRMHLRRRCAAAAASLALCLSLGLSAAAQTSDDDIKASLKKFTDVYRTIESNFADKVDPDQVLFHGAIPTMLRTLDPHSTFWDPKAYETLREEQVGHYYGVGMIIWAPEGKVVVNYPFKGSPAF